MDAIELAFAGAARQARLVADGTVSSRELVGAVPGPHRPPEPGAQRVPRRLRRGRARAGAARRRPPVRRRGRRRAAAGRPRRDQGRRRRRRRRHDLGHRGARAARPAGQPRRGPAARRGRDRRRPDERAGAHAVAVHGDADLRRDPQPVGARPDSGRLERRLGRGRRGRAVRRGAGQRRGGLDPHPGRLVRALRPQAARGGGSRSGPPTPTPGTASRSSGRSRGRSPTPRCSST